MTQGAIYVRELAYRVFLSAEKQEASPSTLKKSLQSYLAAVNFLQVYRGIFLDDPSVLELGEEERTSELTQIDEKSKYAKWRIVEIKKRLISNQSIESIPTSSQGPSANVQSQYQHGQNHVSPVNHLPILSPVYSPPPATSPTSPGALLYEPKVLRDCEKHARHAISALQFDDVESAADNLRMALKLLQPYLRESK